MAFVIRDSSLLAPDSWVIRSVGRILLASEMGALSATLTMWIAETTKPSRRELLAIKSFLERQD